MNKKLMKASIAGAAAIALAAGGSTFAAFSDFDTINENAMGAGFLKLNVDGNGGTASAPLQFGDMAPGQYGTRQAIWVASNDGDSVPDGDLFLTIHNLRNYERGCSTNSEKAVDGSCDNGQELGGELSRTVTILAHSYATDQDTCAGWVGGSDPGPELNGSILPSRRGNLHEPSTHIKLNDAPLAPGDGVCVVVNSYWPKNHNPLGGVTDGIFVEDNAAQGDALKFDMKFDLEQS